MYNVHLCVYRIKWPEVDINWLSSQHLQRSLIPKLKRKGRFFAAIDFFVN